MHDGLLSQGQPACEQMRVGVAGQQHALEKQQTGGPHAGRAAEPRQDVFADEWLDLEQEERPSENGEAVGCHLAGDLRGWSVGGHLGKLADAKARSESIPSGSISEHIALVGIQRA